MRICYFGTFDSVAYRNVSLMRVLEESGTKVVECHMSYWKFKRMGFNRPMLFLINAFNILKIVYKYFLKVGKHDLIFLGSPGERDMAFARLFAFIKRKKIVLDCFPEAHSSKVAKANMILTDTAENARQIAHKFGVDMHNIVVVPVTSFAEKSHARKQSNTFSVGIFGYIPKSSMYYLALAAKKLDDNIKLSLVIEKPKEESAVKNKSSIVAKMFGIVKNVMGSSKSPAKSINAMANLEGISCVQVSESEIANLMDSFDACLVIPEFQYSLPKETIIAMSLGKPVVMPPTPAVIGLSCAVICKKNDAGNLASLLSKLANDSKHYGKISEAVRKAFKENYSPKKTGKIALAAFSRLIG